MRIVTWNMGRTRNTLQAAWHYLLFGLQPDIACVQEALGLSDQIVIGRGSMTWSQAYPGGTGVFVRDGLDFRPIPASLDGSYIVAVTLSIPAVSVFSVHVGPESWRNQEALERWLVQQVHVEPSVVGGDINTSRAYSKRHAEFFNRIAAAGVHDCHWSKCGRETPSFWGKQSTAVIYQDDHFFASPSLAGAVSDCWVDDNPLTRSLSDHGPVVLDIDATLFGK
jgi:exonuclease III